MGILEQILLQQLAAPTAAALDQQQYGLAALAG